jgi:hypothetical protein
MFGEPKSQFSLTCAALSTPGAEKQMSISISSGEKQHQELAQFDLASDALANCRY